MALSNEDYLLVKLAEECNEVGQMVAKCLQFGLDEVYSDGNNILSNKERLFAELNDILGVIQMLNDEEGFGFLPSVEAIKTKGNKIGKYRGYSVGLGKVIL